MILLKRVYSSERALSKFSSAVNQSASALIIASSTSALFLLKLSNFSGSEFV